MRLTLLAAAALVAAAACSPPDVPPPSVGFAEPVPAEAESFSVVLDDAREWFEDYGARCDEVGLDAGRLVRCTYDTRQSEEPYFSTVDLRSSDGAFLDLVEATVILLGSGQTVEDFEGYYSVTVLEVVDRPLDNVKPWLRERIGTTARTEIDRLVIELTNAGQRSSLRVWLAP